MVHGVARVGLDLVVKPNHHQHSCIPICGLELVIRDPGTVTEVQLYRLFPTGCCLRRCPTLNCNLLFKAQSLMVNRVFLTNKRGLFTENIIGFPWWLRRQGICLQCGSPEFDPWVRKIPWRRAWQPTPVLLPGECTWTEQPGGLQSMDSQRVGQDWEATHNMIREVIPLPIMLTHHRNDYSLTLCNIRDSQCILVRKEGKSSMDKYSF